MTTITELLERKSVRMFTDKPVPEDVRKSVLECAIAAPTAGNLSLYTILEIDDQRTKDALAKTCDNQAFIAKSPWVLVFLADYRRWFDGYTYAGCEPRKPGQGELMLAVSDALIAAQNAVVAAHAYSLGSCYIGDIMEQREQVMELLNLDEYVFPIAMLVLGYPKKSQLTRTKPKRFEPDFLVQKDKYRRLTADEHREMFAKRGQEFEEFVRATHKRKYDSVFSAELNRSVRDYLDAFKGE
ncbi:MAG: nitroreductase family protein [Bifidobacteriaceae bacterium]|jgi:nitroreductase|nr:nitroreductase family protein [Bifidobacteriaceae bacterium]